MAADDDSPILNAEFQTATERFAALREQLLSRPEAAEAAKKLRAEIDQHVLASGPIGHKLEDLHGDEDST